MRLSWLEMVFDLLILKELRGKTASEGFLELSWFCMEKLLADARQYILLRAVIAEVMDDENLSLFHIGFLKQGKLQGQRIDVPAIDLKVLRQRTSIFYSQWTKKEVLM